MLVAPRLDLSRPLDASAVHLCIDMQVLFTQEGPWSTPWLAKTLPAVVRLADRFAERTVFTRFIPPRDPAGLPGAWRHFYERWQSVTRERLDPRLLELVPPLRTLVPPGAVFGKPTYSAFAGPALHRHLADRGVDTLVVTGTETEVCVLATVLGALDLGYRAIVVVDAICSSSDEGHDALMEILSTRFHQQIELATVEMVEAEWAV